MANSNGPSTLQRALNHQTDVRGHSRITVIAPLRLRVAAALVDLQVLLTLGTAVLRIAALPPYWDGAWMGPVLGLFLVLQLLQLKLLGSTWGQRVWWMRRLDLKRHEKPRGLRGWIQSRLFQLESPSSSNLTSALALSAISLLVGSGSAYLTLRNHPAWAGAEEVRLEPAFPGTAEQADWIVAPFYYAIGAWPRTFAGQPVLYSIPYEKGPPHQFLGHIIGRWELPETKLILEGPWSPPDRPRPATVAKCLRPGWWAEASECLPVRTASLRRHLEEMAELHPRHWRLSWFEVDNLATPPEERARGILIEAEGESRSQIRYVLINSHGVQQAISVEYVPGHRGDQARELIKRVMQSLRMGEDLFSGRAWADHELERVKISELQKAGVLSSDFLKRYAEVQVLLLSKLSVDPKSYDAFFHLGGTASLLARFARKNRDPELSAAAKPLLRNAFRYAQDLAPNDPRTAQLEALWLEIKAE